MTSISDVARLRSHIFQFVGDVFPPQLELAMASSSSQGRHPTAKAKAAAARVAAALPADLIQGRNVLTDATQLPFAIWKVNFAANVADPPLRNTKLPRALEVWLVSEAQKFPVNFVYYKSGVTRDTWIPADTAKGPWLIKAQYIGLATKE